jgi:hypothetical protein
MTSQVGKPFRSIYIGFVMRKLNIGCCSTPLHLILFTLVNLRLLTEDCIEPRTSDVGTGLVSWRCIRRANDVLRDIFGRWLQQRSRASV